MEKQEASDNKILLMILSCLEAIVNHCCKLHTADTTQAFLSFVDMLITAFELTKAAFGLLRKCLL